MSNRKPSVYQSVHFMEMPKISAQVIEGQDSEDSMYVTFVSDRMELTLWLDMPSSLDEDKRDFKDTTDFATQFSSKITAAFEQAQSDYNIKHKK